MVLKKIFEFATKAAREGQQAHEVEEGIFRLVFQVAYYALQSYFAQKGTGDVGPAIEREDGVVLERESSLRGRVYFSVFGKLDVPRTCYRAPGEPGIFPLDEQVNFPDRRYSYFLQKWMSEFCVEQPFDESALKLDSFFGLDMAASVLGRVAREGQANYDAFYEQKAPPAPETEGELRVVSFDGKGVPVIKAEAAKLKAKLGKGEKRQKKKEALVGVSYTVDRKVRTPEELAETLVEPEKARARREAAARKEGASGSERKEPKARNIRRMASLKRTKRAVMKAIKQDAERRDPQRRRELVILLDGALGLWALVLVLFKGWGKKVWRILDIIHVIKYLWEAGTALHGEGSDLTRAWVKRQLTQILKGRVGYVIGGLKQTITKRGLKGAKRKALEKAIGYFEKHKRWMRYHEYLAAGLPVATGVVESACGSVVKNRMEGEGKRWSVEGAESILLLRSLKKSGDLEMYWRFHARSERERLYVSGPKWCPTADLDQAA
jgi:hypothetical protein